jgi:hypothetical protein
MPKTVAARRLWPCCRRSSAGLTPSGLGGRAANSCCQTLFPDLVSRPCFQTLLLGLGAGPSRSSALRDWARRWSSSKPQPASVQESDRCDAATEHGRKLAQGLSPGVDQEIGPERSANRGGRRRRAQGERESARAKAEAPARWAGAADLSCAARWQRRAARRGRCRAGEAGQSFARDPRSSPSTAKSSPRCAPPRTAP